MAIGNAFAGFAGGLAQGFGQSIGPAMQLRQQQEQQELEKKQQFGMQVLETLQSSFQSGASPALIKAQLALLGKTLGVDPKEFSEFTDILTKASEEERSAIEAVVRQQLGGVPPEQVGAMVKFVLGDPKNRLGFINDIAKAMRDQKGEAFTLSPGQQRFTSEGVPLAEVPATQEQFTLSPGQVRFGEGGQQLAGLPATAPTPTINEVLAPIYAKVARGEELTPGEQQALIMSQAEITGGPEAFTSKPEQAAARKSLLGTTALVRGAEDLIEAVQNRPELLALPAWLARTAQSVRSQVQGLSALAGIDDSQVSHAVEDYAPAFDRIETAAALSNEMRSLIVELAYSRAVAAGNTGTSISNKDVERWIEVLAGSVDDPAIFASNIASTVNRAIENTVAMHRANFPNDPLPNFNFKFADLAQLSKLDAPSGDLEAIIQELTAGEVSQERMNEIVNSLTPEQVQELTRRLQGGQ